MWVGGKGSGLAQVGGCVTGEQAPYGLAHGLVRGGDPDRAVVQQPHPGAAVPGQHTHPVQDAEPGECPVQSVGEFGGGDPVGHGEE